MASRALALFLAVYRRDEHREGAEVKGSGRVGSGAYALRLLFRPALHFGLLMLVAGAPGQLDGADTIHNSAPTGTDVAHKTGGGERRGLISTSDGADVAYKTGGGKEAGYYNTGQDGRYNNNNEPNDSTTAHYHYYNYNYNNNYNEAARRRLFELNSTNALQTMTQAAMAMCCASAICTMIPGTQRTIRDPPGWDPAGNTTFEDWSKDVMIWSIACESDPRRKAAAVAYVLQGEAKRLQRALPPNSLTRG